MWHADHVERKHILTTTGIYRNSTDSGNTRYNRLAWKASGAITKDSNTLVSQAQPDQNTSVEEFEGNIASSAKTIGETSMTANHADFIPYVERSGTFLKPMPIKTEIEIKQPLEGWPAYRKARVDVVFDLATSTVLSLTEPVDFHLDIGELFTNVVILLTALSSSSQYSKRVIMTATGIAKPFVKGNTLRMRATVLHTNHPDDGYDSLTYTATVTIRSAFINWYYNPSDKTLEKLEQAVCEPPPAEASGKPPPRRKFFRALRAMLTPSRRIHN